MYRLKKNVADFVVTDGPFAGRNYRAGETYAEVPSEEKRKFETIEADLAPSLAPISSWKDKKKKIWGGNEDVSTVESTVESMEEGGKK